MEFSASTNGGNEEHTEHQPGEQHYNSAQNIVGQQQMRSYTDSSANTTGPRMTQQSSSFMVDSSAAPMVEPAAGGQVAFNVQEANGQKSQTSPSSKQHQSHAKNEIEEETSIPTSCLPALLPVVAGEDYQQDIVLGSTNSSTEGSLQMQPTATESWINNYQKSASVKPILLPAASNTRSTTVQSKILNKDETYRKSCTAEQPSTLRPGAVSVSDSDTQKLDSSTTKKTAAGAKIKIRSRRVRRGRRNQRLRANNDDDLSLVGGNDADQTTVADATTPPVLRSIDILPSMHFQGNGINSNVVMSASVVSAVTSANSAVTVPFRNIRTGGGDDHSIITTSTMATAGIVNSLLSAIAHRERPRGKTHHLSHTNNSQLINAGALSDSSLDEELVFKEELGEAQAYEDDHLRQADGRWCDVCEIQQTHKKEKYGIFGLLSRMTAQTIEGYVYNGYCLRCHNTYDLRQLLNNPHIPLDLYRREPNSTGASLRMLQGKRMLQVQEQQQQQPNHLLLPTRKRSGPIDILCASIQFQVICGIVVVAVVGACIGIGVTLTKSPEPWVSPPPTMAPSLSPSTPFPSSSPTSFEDKLQTLISKDDVESFGYNVELSRDGTTLAVTSPLYEGSRGRLDVFSIDGPAWRPIGSPIVGNLTNDQLGIGMHLSADGKVVAVGLPGNNAGMVQVYTVDRSTGLSKRGGPISGPTPLSQFGASVSLNLDGSRLFVGAPKFGDIPSEIYGLVQAYDFDGTDWVAAGRAMIGEIPDSDFGISLSTDDSGDRIVIGAPKDSQIKEDAGQVFVMDMVDKNWIKLDMRSAMSGSQLGSQLGRKVVLHCAGTVMASGGRDREYENFPDAGVVKTRGLEKADLFVSFSNSDLGTYFYDYPSSGSYEGAHIGYDLQLDCGPTNLQIPVVLVASSQNRNGQAGSLRLQLLRQYEGPEYVNPLEFAGPELGISPWLGKGPSIAVAKEGLQIAVGYESIRHNGSSRSEVRIYDITNAWN